MDKTRLNNINTQIFNALNNMDIETTMSFSTFLYSLSIDKQTYIDSLRIKLKNQLFFYNEHVKMYVQIHLVYMLGIFGKQTLIFNLYLIHMQQQVIILLI